MTNAIFYHAKDDTSKVKEVQDLCSDYGQVLTVVSVDTLPDSDPVLVAAKAKGIALPFLAFSPDDILKPSEIEAYFKKISTQNLSETYVKADKINLRETEQPQNFWKWIGIFLGIAFLIALVFGITLYYKKQNR
jgi:hypothetical protein